MSLNFLDFEQPIAELEAKIDSLTAGIIATGNGCAHNIDHDAKVCRADMISLTHSLAWWLVGGEDSMI